jgi:hypothetical protein
MMIGVVAGKLNTFTKPHMAQKEKQKPFAREKKKQIPGQR